MTVQASERQERLVVESLRRVGDRDPVGQRVRDEGNVLVVDSSVADPDLDAAGRPVSYRTG